MRFFVLAIFMVFGAVNVARADVASTNYVTTEVGKRVSLAGSDTQTMSGTYDVQGEMSVKTPKLPEATE